MKDKGEKPVKPTPEEMAAAIEGARRAGEEERFVGFVGSGAEVSAALTRIEPEEPCVASKERKPDGVLGPSGISDPDRAVSHAPSVRSGEEATG